MMRHNFRNTDAATEASDARSRHGRTSRDGDMLPRRPNPRYWAGSPVFALLLLLLLHNSCGCPGHVCANIHQMDDAAAASSAALGRRLAANTTGQGQDLEFTPTGPHMEMEVQVAEREESPSAGEQRQKKKKRERESPSEPAKLLSPEWLDEYGKGEPGCELARGHYVWREAGFGSNLNNLLYAWVNALAVERWVDVAIIIEHDQMGNINCATESQGQASTGWECMFMPTPHLCTFKSVPAWQNYMTNTKNITGSELAKAGRTGLYEVWDHQPQIYASLKGLGFDYKGALSVMAKYLWNHVTQWLQADVDFITAAPPSDVFETARFLALHVRRSDKITTGEAQFHPCEEYLDAAVTYVESDDCNHTVEDIKGIWVASDDPKVVDRVKEIAPSYLPNVNNDTIFWAGGGVEGGPDISKLATNTTAATYADFAYFMADVQQCTAADVFVGTFSSNMGRVVALLRESSGLKRTRSTISVDTIWYPGRSRQRQRRGLQA